MVEVDPERFEAMVSEALDGVPEELGELMSNVGPSPSTTTKGRRGPIWGSTRGFPDPPYERTTPAPCPDRITIYRRAICAVCSSQPEVVDQVRRTVIHEIGHHFGIGDARLRELGW